VVDGVLTLWMDRIDRENRIYETMDPNDGTWRTVGLYERNQHVGAFVIPKSQTRDIMKKMGSA